MKPLYPSTPHRQQNRHSLTPKSTGKGSISTIFQKMIFYNFCHPSHKPPHAKRQSRAGDKQDSLFLEGYLTSLSSHKTLVWFSRQEVSLGSFLLCATACVTCDFTAGCNEHCSSYTITTPVSAGWWQWDVGQVSRNHLNVQCCLPTA